MGTLSGGGTQQITLGERCLLGANSGIGISLGDDCVVEAGLYITAGTPVLTPDGVLKARELSGHDNLMFIRDGQSELTPAVTGLGRAEMLDTVAFTRTWLTEYNRAEWTRSILWRRGDYFLISDEVRALQDGDFTLRCCWRPWGEATLDGGTLTVQHPPMRMVIANADGASCRLERMKVSEGMPISRLSQQVSLPMRQGEGYRFVNLLHAEPSDQARRLSVRRSGERVVVVERPEGWEVIAFGLGQGATLVGAGWGVFVWREFRTAPRGTTPILAAMFLIFIAGLILITFARVM